MKIFSTKKTVAVLVSLLGAQVFAQSVSFPKIDPVTSSSMPTIDAPTLGGSYYVPGWTQNRAPKASEEIKSADSVSVEKKQEDLKSLLTDEVLPTLTADEVQTLNVNGVLESVLEKKYKKEGASDETDNLLRQVLSEMEEIKKQNGQTSVKISNPPAQKVVPQNKGSRLLRFKVNGYDILHTCRTVFISDVQEDGTFLVTGDRRYQSDGVSRTETFHLLFKADSGANGVKSYNAAAAVTQDYLNENSFLYQMSKKDMLQANRTGNLVTLRTQEPDWKLELLIDLGASSR